jgi:FAD/FMN-containing dehydrogenase
MITRRRFLGAAAVTLAGGACQVPPGRTSGPPSPSPRPTAAVTAADWAALAGRLKGTLVLPADALYANAHRLFNPVFDAIAPAAVAYCQSEADVASCVGFARDHGVTPIPRSGGHSYAGYSTGTGLVVDVSRMRSVAPGAGTAVIGAGARMIDVYAGLAAAGVMVPAGSCPTVGIAGLTLGGGVGVLSRKYGLTSDNLLAARVVTADGRTLVCDATHEPDLHWALRGGGGGNFGVVTELTFRTSPAPGLALFSLRWPWGQAGAVLTAWQGWAPGAPDELWSNCLLLSSDGTAAGAQPTVRVTGVFAGTVAQASAALSGLLSGVGAAPLQRSLSAQPFLEAMKIEGGCAGYSLDQCSLQTQNPAGLLTRDPFAARSDYLAAALPAAGVAAAVAAVERRQAAGGLASGGLAFDAYGGAINRVPADATAFVHRAMRASIQYSANWRQADPAAVVSVNQAWLNDAQQALRPFVSGAAYQNYIDPNLAGWQQAYYGANLRRLVAVKQRYDPREVFRFPQGIPAG